MDVFECPGFATIHRASMGGVVHEEWKGRMVLNERVWVHLAQNGGYLHCAGVRSGSGGKGGGSCSVLCDGGGFLCWFGSGGRFESCVAVISPAVGSRWFLCSRWMSWHFGNRLDSSIHAVLFVSLSTPGLRILAAFLIMSGFRFGFAWESAQLASGHTPQNVYLQQVVSGAPVALSKAAMSCPASRRMRDNVTFGSLLVAACFGLRRVSGSW